MLWLWKRTSWVPPLLPSAAVLTLAMGISLAGTIFGFTYGTVLVDLPFDGRGRWVLVERLVNGDDADGRVNVEDLHAWREDCRAFDLLAGFEAFEASLAEGTDPAERVRAARVEVAAIDATGVGPIRGRRFFEAEGRTGGPEVVLLGERLWQRRFGADPGLVGRTVRVDGSPREVVGIMPAGFGFPVNQELWLPLRLGAAGRPRETADQVFVVGRVAANASIAGARLDLARIDADFARRVPRSGSGLTTRVEPYTTGMIGAEIVRFQLAMLGVAVLVLAVAAVNVANLLLARGVARTREFAVRATLGASRLGLASRVLGETALIAALGGLLGVGLAGLGLAALTDTIAAAGIIPFFWFDLGLTPATLAGIAGLAMVATLVSGIPPAFQASHGRSGEVLKEGRGATSVRISRAMRGLVVAQLALTTAILSSAGVMIRSMQSLRSRDYGFEAAGMHTAKVSLPAAYDSEQRARFWGGLLQQLSAEARVSKAALTSALPVREFPKVHFIVGGREPVPPVDVETASVAAISPAFFDVLGANVLEGRAFTAFDTAQSPAVAIVNQSFARRHFVGVAALGASLEILDVAGTRVTTAIVGIVPDLWMDGPRNRRPDGLYVPLSQRDASAVRVITRGTGGERSLRAAVAAALTAVDADVPAYESWSMEAVIARASFFYRFLPSLFLVFGGAALGLASVGLFAVMTFAVQRRRLELSIRLALGSTPGGLARLVLRRAMGELAIGLLVGCGMGLLLNQSLTRFIVSVTAADPVSFGAVGLVLVTVCGMAALGPAVGAGRVHPIESLRAQ